VKAKAPRAGALGRVFAYFETYDRKSFHVVACQGNEPSEADVAAFEQLAGFRLPDDFREFTKSGLGGLYMEVSEDLWPPAKRHDVGPAWSFWRAIKVFGIASDIPEWLDIRKQLEGFRVHSREHVPFLQIESDADRYCFDRSGAIVRWDHETGDFTPVNGTFAELLLREIRELEQRKERVLHGERRAR